MLTIVRSAETKIEYAYRRIFRAEYECCGFICDENGNPLFRGKYEELRFNECLQKPDKYKDCGRVRREYTNITPALGRCECGRTLSLDRFTIRCRCGRYYRSTGEEIIREAKRQ